MAYKDLLLTLASYPEATPPAAIDLAVDFAAAIRARISAIACEVRIAVPGSFLSPALLDVGSIAAADEKKSRLQAEALLAAFQAAAEKQDVYEERILARCLTSELSGLLVDYARLRDLTIMPAEDDGFSGPWNPEAVVFGSGRPVLLLPRASQKPFALDTATVAWDFSRPAARAVADALPLLARPSVFTSLRSPTRNASTPRFRAGACQTSRPPRRRSDPGYGRCGRPPDRRGAAIFRTEP